MKKKVLLYGLLLLLAVAMGVFGVVSCNKDDSKSNNTEGVIGTWVGSKYTMTFNDDNTGVIRRKYSYGDEYYNEKYFMFTYTMTSSTSGVIKVKDEDGYYGYYDDEEIVTFKISGNTMTLYVSYSDYNYEWVEDVLTRQGSNPSSGTTTNVVGTWEGSEVTLIFNSDNTGVIREKNDYYGYQETYVFTYTMTGSNSGRIYSNYDDDEVVVTFKVTNENTMILYGAYEGEYEWVIDILTR